MIQFSSQRSMKINFDNRIVNGRVISISSYFNHNTDLFFEQELIKQNTVEIVKPLAKITFLKENQDSKFWKEGFNYQLEIKLFGLINMWGIHHISIVRIEKLRTEIVTIEKNNICKVWNHKLTFKKLSENETEYTDEVTLYAGWLTGVLSQFLIYSYKKRHRNWDKLLNLSNSIETVKP
jgi:hypothetical protein